MPASQAGRHEFDPRRPLTFSPNRIRYLRRSAACAGDAGSVRGSHFEANFRLSRYARVTSPLASRLDKNGRTWQKNKEAPPVLFEITPALGAGNRHDVFALVQ